MSIRFATINEIRTAIDSGSLSIKEVLEETKKNFETIDSEVKSALEIFDIQSIIESSRNSGKLYGVPGIIKDNISQKGRRLTCASKMLANYVAPYNATAIDNLLSEGAMLVGRANLDEFAMGVSTQTSAFFKTHNPWDLTRVPGGSSGGSIAAVAAGLVPWALGSDTGGSVRQPAGFCGIIGMKPTYGLVSRFGLVAYASSLDQIGVATRTVEDNAIVMSVIAGHDLKDSSSLRVATKDYAVGLDGRLPEGVKIGVIDNMLSADGLNSEVRDRVEEAISQLERMGATVRRIKIPIMEYSAAAYFIISRAEAASNLARFDGVRYGFRSKKSDTLEELYTNTRHDGFGDEVKIRILVGNYVLSAGHAGDFYNNAKAVQRLIGKAFREAFNDLDALICPTQVSPAFKMGAFDGDKRKLDLDDLYTASANLAGIPAISVPCGFSSGGLPIGMQFFGPPLSEGVLYKIADAYEKETGWWNYKPSI